MSLHRVLHVLLPGAFGGLEEVVRQLATAQQEAGFDVTCVLVVTPERIPPLEAEIRDAGVRVERIETRPRAYLEQRRLMHALLARSPAAVVHTHGYHADVLLNPVARAAGAATVTTLHGFCGGDLKNRLFEHLQIRAARNAGCAVAVSRPIAQRLKVGGVDAERLLVIPNVRRAEPQLPRADARARLGINTVTPLIGWVGRLSGEKGADVLLDALGTLPTGAVAAAILGDGPELPSLRAQSRALGLEPYVHFTGRVSRAAAYLSAFDLLVLSSRTEGTPMVLLEAMQARVPIVATEVGGVPDMLTRAEALLVPSESPKLLGAAIANVLKWPAEAALRAERALEHVSGEPSLSLWVRAYEAAYADAVSLRKK